MSAALFMFGIAVMLFLLSTDKPLTARDLALVFWLIGLAFLIQAAVTEFRKCKP